MKDEESMYIGFNSVDFTDPLYIDPEFDDAGTDTDWPQNHVEREINPNQLTYADLPWPRKVHSPTVNVPNFSQVYANARTVKVRLTNGEWVTPSAKKAHAQRHGKRMF